VLVRPEDWIPQGIVDLEPRAWQAVRQVQRSVLVTAGAGAGKTEFLAQKAAFLLQTGLCADPKRILAISFKRDAARNLSERVEERCASEHSRRFNSLTFDSFAKNLLDRFRTAIPPSYRPSANYRIVMPRAQDYRDFLERRGLQFVNVSNFERAVARTALPIERDSPAPIVRAVEEYWRTQFRDYDEPLLTFPMINRLINLLLIENPDIQKALHLTYPIVFLDEFQDTTFSQFELLETAFRGSETVFTAVGDNKQRIMMWAGAVPDAFRRFEDGFGADRISLLSNWRSHEDLVRIQHVIARRIDPTVEYPRARGTRQVDGDIAAIWQFDSVEDENIGLATWIVEEVRSGRVNPHDIAILARTRIDTIEEQLLPRFMEQGLMLRNLARNVGDISIQDLLDEDLTAVFLPLLRLGATATSPDSWNKSLRNMQYLTATDPSDDLRLEQLQSRLEGFVRDLRSAMTRLQPTPESVDALVQDVLDFVRIDWLRQAFPAYRRTQDFERVRSGLSLLLRECAEHADTWVQVLDEFEGLDQVALMTIHKSKGLEFHTVIFYGLDNETWWSLTPDRLEELNSFFVAFTRAKQRAFFSLCTERGQPVAWIENLLAPVGIRRIAM
jgi:superfamily I DNA/RNA helicase